MIFTAILAVLTIFVGWILFNHWKMPFNSEGSYFDVSSGVVYHQQAVLVYGLVTFILLSATIWSGYLAIKYETRNKVTL